MIQRFAYGTIILLFCSLASLYAQGPAVWVFGKNAGIDFTSNKPVPVSYPIDNSYAPSSSLCDATGNLLFYCDGRSIKYKSGALMSGSENTVWPSATSQYRKIVSNIVPADKDTSRYFVFTLTPSFGNPPYGSYHSGALTYSVVDRRLNDGKGGIDPAIGTVLLNTELELDMIVVPSDNCNHWLITYRKTKDSSQFVAYLISDNEIGDPIYSTVHNNDFPYLFNNLKMVYAYKHHKIFASSGSYILAALDFDNANGRISNAKMALDLAEFRSNTDDIGYPSFCLSPDENVLYLLGHAYTTGNPGVSATKLQQFPLNWSAPSSLMNTPVVLFQSGDPLYRLPNTELPYYSPDCAIRVGPDSRIYMFYYTGMSFLGKINKPDQTGTACDFEPQGLPLLPGSYGSCFFPAIENKHPNTKIDYRVHDTTLCLAQPLLLKPEPGREVYSTFQWDDGSSAAVKEIMEEGTFWVKSSRSCYEAQQVDTFIIRSEKPDKCNCHLFVPTAFSPNNDHLNDLFQPIIPFSCLNGDYQLSIYNRWGTSIFHSYDILNGWDGTINGQYAEIGVYHYLIHYRDSRNLTQTDKGTLTLIR